MWRSRRGEWGSGGACGGPAPAALAFRTDASPLFALGGEDIGVLCVGVAPPQVGVDLLRHDEMARVVGVVEHELAQRTELALDRVGPRAVGRGEAQLDGMLLAPGPDLLTLVGREVVQDHVDRLAVGPLGADLLQGGQRVGRPLLLPHGAEEEIVAHAVAAVELADASGLVEVGPQPLGRSLLRPAASPDRVQRERAELVEGEDPLGVVLDHLFDAVELLVAERVVRLLPGLGPLEGHIVSGQDRPQAFPADHDPTDRVVGEVRRQPAQAPAGEGKPDRLGPGLGRLDDEHLVVSRDPAGTATRPPGVQAGHPHLVEAMDHLSHPVRRGLDQSGDRVDAVATGRREDHHRPAPLHDGLVGLPPAPPHNPLELTAFFIAEPPYPQPSLSHATRLPETMGQMVDSTYQRWRSGH